MHSLHKILKIINIMEETELYDMTIHEMKRRKVLHKQQFSPAEKPDHPMLFDEALRQQD